MIERYNRPFFFYGLSLILPWVLWSAVAYMSHQEGQTRFMEIVGQSLGLLGLIAPALVAAYLFSKDPDLLVDIKERFIIKKDVRGVYYLITFLLIFLSMVIAQLLSLFLRHSLQQFHISGDPTFTSTLFSPWFILIFAPIAEELAWHSYGTDTIRRKFSLFTTSMIFAFYWVIWHLPLSFIKGYYHANVVAEGLIYSLNFMFSLFVFVVIMNWLYYKTKRSVLVTIVFHLSANLTNEIFATHPDSKVIQTVLLLIFAVYILIKDRAMFFGRDIAGEET